MNKVLMSIVFLVILSLSATAQANSPNGVIEEAVDLLAEGLESRRDEFADDKQALYAFIDGILLPRFERRFAAGVVLGKHWRTATDEQKSRFIDAFYMNLVHRYADGLLEFDTDRVEILPFRGDTSRPMSLVKTNVTLDDGTKVPVHYELVKRKDRWLMFNVKIEGISYVKNYRQELDAEIKSSSLDEVIDRLEAEATPADGE